MERVQVNSEGFEKGQKKERENGERNNSNSLRFLFCFFLMIKVSSGKS